MKLSSFWKGFIILIVFFLSIYTVQGQALNSWRAYLSYQKAKMIEETPDGYVYAVYEGEPAGLSATRENGSLLKYRLTSNGEEVQLLSKVTGLNDVIISQIAYCPDQKILIIVYDNGNIDLLDTASQDIFNIRDFIENNDIADKSIREIDVFGKYAYICFNAGVWVLDIERKELKNRYIQGKETYSVCFWGEYMYAATNDGVYRANKNINLLPASNWEYYPLNYGGYDKAIRKVLVFKNQLVFYQPESGVYRQESNGSISPVSTHPNTFNQVTTLQNQLIMLDNNNIYFYSDFTPQPEHTLANANTLYISSLNNSDTYWLAQDGDGICKIKKSTGEKSNNLKIDSPKRNLVFYMTHSYGKLLVVGGEGFVNNHDYAGTFMVFENEKWFNADEKAIETETGIVSRDFMCAIVDPRDRNHYFVSSYGSGLYEFKDNQFVKLHNDINTNGALKSALPNESFHSLFVRLGGLAYDNQNNLYILNENAIPEQIAMYSATNEWSSLYYSTLPRVPVLRDIVLTKNKQKWINAPRPLANHRGLFVIDDKGTIDTSDDISLFSTSFKDQDGETLDIVNFNCITEDQSGTIWVGTNIGPIIFHNPKQITTNGKFDTCSRAKIPKNDGTDNADYLLNGVPISAISVDGGNRKWIGTAGAGLFLVTPSGDQVISNFTAENSPLLSNNIKTVTINDESGEIFIGTDKGIISYTNLATEGKSDYSNVYAYPNPVKPDFLGDVVITGLMKDSNVKITDLSGNIISQGTSVGGQFSWDCKYQGKRVKTGVYLVFGANNDGTEGVVTKIVVVR